MDCKTVKVHNGSNTVNGEVTTWIALTLVLRSVGALGMRIFRIGAVRRIESGFHYSDVDECRYATRVGEDSWNRTSAISQS
jgi:hypothetical protein